MKEYFYILTIQYGNRTVSATGLVEADARRKENEIFNDVFKTHFSQATHYCILFWYLKENEVVH